MQFLCHNYFSMMPYRHPEAGKFDLLSKYLSIIFLFIENCVILLKILPFFQPFIVFVFIFLLSLRSGSSIRLIRERQGACFQRVSPLALASSTDKLMHQPGYQECRLPRVMIYSRSLNVRVLFFTLFFLYSKLF